MEMEVYFPGGKRVDSRYNGFTVKTDQAKKWGGDGSAPEPFHLFLASIGTCAGIYVLSFCQNRKLNTEGTRLFLRFERNNETKMIDSITVDVRLPKGFPEKYKSAVIRAVDLCAVKRHMEQPPKFEVLVNVAE